jgi:hypothetical protein
MRPGCTPVDRRANVLCYNTKCSLCVSFICEINSRTYRDRSRDQRSEIGGQR